MKVSLLLSRAKYNAALECHHLHAWGAGDVRNLRFIPDWAASRGLTGVREVIVRLVRE